MTDRGSSRYASAQDSLLVLRVDETPPRVLEDAQGRRFSVATLNERHTGSNRARWIALLLVGAAIAVVVVLVVLYGGGGSGAGPY